MSKEITKLNLEIQYETTDEGVAWKIIDQDGHIIEGECESLFEARTEVIAEITSYL